MSSSSLIKTTLNNAVADGIYNELTSGYAKYYYFLGRTLKWEDELNPPFPVDSISYENMSRNEMITVKQIKPTDLSYVIKRIDWVSGDVYDQYDDQYSTEVQGINLIYGGNSYATIPNVYIGSTEAVNWSSGEAYVIGQLIKANTNFYLVTNTGISGTTMPTTVTTGTDTFLDGTVSLQSVSVHDGGGFGATATATILDGRVIGIKLTHKGIGYTTPPSVIIYGANGGNASATSIVNIASNGAQRIEDCSFYVVTDEYNVYTCLDNNNGSQSTYKPTGTGVDPVSTADGYIWKFLYSIPIALRNKFVTGEYIPVVTALRNQFYSNGTLQTIRIGAGGTNYTSGSIVVQGDGYLAADPYYLTTYVLQEEGDSYSGAVTITIDPPVKGTVSWLPSQAVIVGQKVNYNNNIYNVAVSGTTDDSQGPTHRYGIVQNGTAQLQYFGSTPTGTATVSGGKITGVTFYGMLRDISMVSGGSGYTSAPTLTFSGGGGSGAQGIAVLQNTSVIRVIITDPGTGYTSAPTIKFGTEWQASTAVTVNQQIFYSNRLYTVVAAGTTGSTAPTHNSGTVSNGTASLQYVGKPAAATSSIKYGAGYSTTPAVLLTASTGSGAQVYFNSVKSEAKLVPIFSDGQLSGVQIDDEGIGYSYANLTVQGDGSGAIITADLSPGDVTTLQANVELLTVDGGIANIPVLSGGFGYSTANITINGDGTGATAHAIIAGGAIKKIVIDSYGSGYRWATISISGNGFGAAARAIVSPYGGHGKEAIKQLYGRTLMFYSNISQDKNQGFDVNNDYRQIGILKAPRQYNNTHNLTSVYASACWVISGVINSVLFPTDALITRTSDGARFRIVTNNGSAILAQSLDNAIPISGDAFENTAGDIFTCSGTTAPTIDKYSGYLMYIDNKSAFTPTADQTVTLRTVIKF